MELNFNSQEMPTPFLHHQSETSNTGLPLRHKLSAALVIIICFLLTIGYGWLFYCTLTERSGFRGNMHSYYQLSPFQFALYTWVLSLSSFIFFVLVISNMLEANIQALKKVLSSFMIFVFIIFICEGILALRYVGKG